MFDKRYDKFAEILVDHSLTIKKDDLFLISGSPLAKPLISSVFQLALKRGAHPFIRLGLESLNEIYYTQATKDQLQYISPVDLFEMKTVDARLSIISPENTRYMTHVDPNQQVIRSKAAKPLHDIFLKRAKDKDLRWCVTIFPTQASAQDADMSLHDYEEFVFKAAQIHKKDPKSYWQQLGKEQHTIKKRLETKKKLRILAENTDLTLSVENRTWIPCYGKENFPDGEIFTGPVEQSAEGKITFSFPLVYGGRRVDDVTLYFKKGKVIDADASTGKEFLLSMLDVDKGARYLGEIAFGLNKGIKDYSKNTLFDEKIGGSIHLALGSGYPETGSNNVSSIHWDMVCDLRKNGEVLADGECIFKKGKFLF